MLKKSSPEKIILFLCIALILGFWMPGHISVTLTPSLGHRVFYLSQAEDMDFNRGDYLLFRKDLDHAQTDFLLKEVGCAPGDRLTEVGRQFFCNQILLGEALEKDSKGNTLPLFVYDGVIPEGKFFMKGIHERSYDSKSFGFIDEGNVIKKAWPIF